jgi:hypothetical protein
MLLLNGQPWCLFFCRYIQKVIICSWKLEVGWFQQGWLKNIRHFDLFEVEVFYLYSE